VKKLSIFDAKLWNFKKKIEDLELVESDSHDQAAPQKKSLVDAL
jgi:hypothetical protein